MKQEKTKKSSIGGQAVIDGVMMRGKKSMATAVRDEDGIIRIESKRFKPTSEKNIFFRLPIIRGVISFGQSLFLGTGVLMRSAEVFGESEPSKTEKWLSDKFKINLMSVVMTMSVILGLVLSIFLFVFLPSLFTKWIFPTGGGVVYNLVEGLIRIAIFVLYLFLCSLIKDVKRTFMYHGAEHKTISCYEKGLELTVENAKTCSRLHNRCGTTFMFFVMIVSILVFSLANVTNANLFLRMLIKIAFLPLVAGISYELLKLLAKSDFFLLYIFKAPGLLLQKITTKEPDDKMLEVAICAFKEVMDMDEDKSISEQRFVVAKKCNILVKELKEDFAKCNIDETDAEWIVSIVANIKRDELDKETLITPKYVEKITNIAEERKTGKPLWYIIGDTEFYGYKIRVNENVLIPRAETELLVEQALKEITFESRVLDLCTGSGAIAIAVKKIIGCEVTASDVSEKAIEIARQNAQENNADIQFIKSDFFNEINGEKYDIIISNPPYIKSEEISTLEKELSFEPKLALDGGKDGLDAYRIICKEALNHLNNGGKLFLEIGQGQESEIFKFMNEYEQKETIKDFNGIERIIKAVKKKND